MNNTAAVKGICQFGFKIIFDQKDDMAAEIKKGYEEAISKTASERSPKEHMLVASGGDLDKALQLATTAALRTVLCSSLDDEFQVGRGSIKVTYDSPHAV